VKSCVPPPSSLFPLLPSRRRCLLARYELAHSLPSRCFVQINSNEYSLVDFHADWCGPCHVRSSPLAPFLLPPLAHSTAPLRLWKPSSASSPRDGQSPLLQGRRRCPAGDLKIRRRRSYHAHHLRLQVWPDCQHHGRRQPQGTQGMSQSLLPLLLPLLPLRMIADFARFLAPSEHGREPTPSRHPIHDP
jgi:hypothetical protein